MRTINTSTGWLSFMNLRMLLATDGPRMPWCCIFGQPGTKVNLCHTFFLETSDGCVMNPNFNRSAPPPPRC